MASSPRALPHLVARRGRSGAASTTTGSTVKKETTAILIYVILDHLCE